MLDEILKQFSNHNLNALSMRVKECAIGCGKYNGSSKELSDEEWKLVDNISESLWESDKPIEWKVEAGFAFFEKFPSYFHALVPFYMAIRYERITHQVLKDKIWKAFARYLKAESEYCDPVKYVLWVEFFEDPETVKESWHGVTGACQELGGVEPLLSISGPVPWEYKRRLYEEQVSRPENHRALLEALLFSAYDVYGKIHIKEARKLLTQLKVDKNSDDYQRLIQNIGEV